MSETQAIARSRGFLPLGALRSVFPTGPTGRALTPSGHRREPDRGAAVAPTRSPLHHSRAGTPSDRGHSKSPLRPQDSASTGTLGEELRYT